MSSLAELRDELERRGIRLTKRFGQNFMMDPNMAATVARVSGAGAGDVVLEAGTGAGHLTRELMSLGANVVGVEIDHGLAAFGLERLAREAAELFKNRAGSPPSFMIVMGDVMAKGGVIAEMVARALSEAMDAAGRDSFRVASNLPYGIAATFLVALASSDLPWSGGAVTTQKEVAQRLVASPGTKAYGAATVLWQLRAKARIDRVIPPEVFWPRPEVESALLVIEPLAEGARGPDAGFATFVKALFSQRRKVLRTSVARAARASSAETVVTALEAAGIDPEGRVEDVAPETLCVLWRELSGN